MGSGRHVDEVRLRVVGCREGTHPLPENLELAWEITFHPGERVDMKALSDELAGVIVPEYFELEEKYKRFSWGADAAMAEIVIGVTSGTAVLVIDRLIEAVLKRARRPEENLALDGEAASRSAREFLAKARRVAPESVDIEELEPLSEGFLVRLKTADGEQYSVEIDSGNGVYKLTRE